MKPPMTIRILALMFLFALSVSANDESPTVTAIRALQPIHEEETVATWAYLFDRAGRSADLDPLLLVSIAFRESSLLEGRIGSRGEVGLMQLHGAALQFLPRGCPPDEVECSIRGGAAYLSYCREFCGGSWNRWVGAYGMSRCPTETIARSEPSVVRVREIYRQIQGSNWNNETTR